MSTNMYKYPSMTSVASMASLGHLPPGHGYIPRRYKPDKPYGPDYITTMNRTWRGPGKKYLYYALFCACMAILFFTGAGVYWGHRNVSRMMVYRTEVLAAVMTVIGILFTSLAFHFIWKARVESNRWREYVRFRAEGLFSACAYNDAYVPEAGMKLASGTYGPRAVKEIPKPGRQKRGRSRAASQSSLRQQAVSGATKEKQAMAEEGRPPPTQPPTQAPPPPGQAQRAPPPGSQTPPPGAMPGYRGGPPPPRVGYRPPGPPPSSPPGGYSSKPAFEPLPPSPLTAQEMRYPMESVQGTRSNMPTLQLQPGGRTSKDESEL